MLAELLSEKKSRSQLVIESWLRVMEHGMEHLISTIDDRHLAELLTLMRLTNADEVE